MARIPQPLQELLDEFAGMDSDTRAAMLLEYSDEFNGVPQGIARRPYPEEHRVPACESEAYVWSEPGPDGTVRFHFAIENPQGVSAKALSVILARTVSGAKAEEAAAIPMSIVNHIFGRELSMGKGAGLQGIVGMMAGEAAMHLRKTQGRA